MSQFASFRVSNNHCHIVEGNRSDQTSATLTFSRAPVRFENNQLPDECDESTCVNRSSLVIAELSEKTSLEQRLHLLPASIARFLLRSAEEGSCPPLPILRLLGFCTQAEIDTGRRSIRPLALKFNAYEEGRLAVGA